MKFDFDNRHYDLNLKSMAVQIVGESAIGKSLMFQDLQAYINKHPELNLDAHFLFVNAQNRVHYTDVLLFRKYQGVIIDNADIVITPAIDEEIISSQKSGNTQWIIIGREPRGSIITNSVGTLVHTLNEGNYHFSIDYKQR